MKFPPVPLRTPARLLEIDLEALREYCRQANSFFERRKQKFEKNISEKDPRSIDPDTVVDARAEMEHHLDLNGYFGLLMTYSGFEEFLQDLYEYTRYLATVPSLRDLMRRHTKSWLKLDEYKSFFKEFDIDLSKSPFEWAKLKRLQRLRNLIAHQGGVVTSEYASSFPSEGYKEGDSLRISMKEVEQNIELVKVTADRLVKEFTDALRKKRLI
jgi:HEPN superfamily RiboL-PSP-like protein